MHSDHITLLISVTKPRDLQRKFPLLSDPGELTRPTNEKIQVTASDEMVCRIALRTRTVLMLNLTVQTFVTADDHLQLRVRLLHDHISGSEIPLRKRQYLSLVVPTGIICCTLLIVSMQEYDA